MPEMSLDLSYFETSILSLNTQEERVLLSVWCLEQGLHLEFDANETQNRQKYPTETGASFKPSVRQQ